MLDELPLKINQRGSAICVGLDPQIPLMPRTFLDGALSTEEVGAPQDFADPKVCALYIEKFCQEVIDVIVDYVPIVKPNTAFFEVFGSYGMIALEEVTRYARERDLLVLLDAKRGDISSTAKFYASAYLSANSLVQADALTVTPFAGQNTLDVYHNIARQRDKMIFAWLHSSESYEWHHQMALHLQKWLAGHLDAGAVVGGDFSYWRHLLPDTWFLTPGYGAQGKKLELILAARRQDGLGLIVNSSRSILYGDRHSVDWKRDLEYRVSEFHKTFEV